MTTKTETIRALMTLVDKHTDDLKEGEYLDICDFLKQSFEQVNPTTTNESFSTPADGYTQMIGRTTGFFTPTQSTVGSIAETIENVMDEVNSVSPPVSGIIVVTDDNTNPPPPTIITPRPRPSHRPSLTDWITVITETAPLDAITRPDPGYMPVATGVMRIYLEQIKRQVSEYSTRTGWTPPKTFDVLVHEQMWRRIAITRERRDEERERTRGV